MQGIHDSWGVDICPNLNHLVLIPASHPYIDDIEFIACMPSESLLGAGTVKYSRCLRRTGIHDTLELNFLHRPSLIATTVDGLRVYFKFVGVVKKQDTHSAQRVHIEMHQIMIVTSDRVVTNYSETDILVDQGEQLAHVLFQILEGIPDVHLRYIFAVGGGILEVETFAIA